jgi:hypothetical protein
MIRGTPRRTPRAFVLGGAGGRPTGEAPPVTDSEIDVLTAADETRKAVVRNASAAAYDALVAVCDSRASDDTIWHLRAAARALLRHKPQRVR